jgi:hypothetical protein
MRIHEVLVSNPGECRTRFDIVTAMTVKFTVRQDMTPSNLCLVNEVSEERIASIFRVRRSLCYSEDGDRYTVTMQQITRPHMPVNSVLLMNVVYHNGVLGF